MWTNGDWGELPSLAKNGNKGRLILCRVEGRLTVVR